MQMKDTCPYGVLVLGLILVVISSASCQASLSSGSSFYDSQVLGGRFQCNDPGWVTICLSVLRESCSLSIAPGRGLPRKPGDKLVLIHGAQGSLVTGPADLVGCVDIKNDVDALEYLRFFSSFETVYLFAQQELEVYKGRCFAVCLPADRWDALKLAQPTIVSKENGFKVTRFLFRPTVNRPEVQLFRVVQEVRYNGAVLTLESEPIPTPMSWKDRLKLRFPQFM
jgi:hypothetical protein